MSSRHEREDFIETVIPSDLLDTAIEWLKTNMSPDQVFEDEALIKWAHDNDMRTLEETAGRFSPEDVFEQHVLRDWAEQNGYVEQ